MLWQCGPGGILGWRRAEMSGTAGNQGKRGAGREETVITKEVE